jgi:hypothetical protein
MIQNSSNKWPIFAPIKIEFDQDKLYDEIVSSNILEKSKVATTQQVNGKNFWDDQIHFKCDKFKKLKEVPLWDDKKLTPHTINTFYQVNVTTFNEDDLIDVWKGEHKTKTRIPLWISEDYQWQYRSDYNLPYLESIIKSIGLNYVSMVRIIIQDPPSIGLIHKDSGVKTNSSYYDSGGVNITLNVTTGQANLFFIDEDDKERHIDENSIKAWHFNDGVLHCTSEVSSKRIQIRIYGNHPNYKSIMDLTKAI